MYPVFIIIITVRHQVQAICKLQQVSLSRKVGSISQVTTPFVDKLSSPLFSQLCGCYSTNSGQ